MAAVEISGDLKSGLGFGGASIVEDLLVGIQRLASPVSRDLGEKAMLDGIPFGSASGIVGHGHSKSKRVGELGLELGFPGVTAATVAAAGIGQNEELAGTGIAMGTFLSPPISDGMSSKGGSIVRNTDDQSAAIFVHIVNPIRDGDSDGVGAEVVIIDAAWGRFPTTAGILKVAHEFAFFAVHADDGQMTTLEAVPQFGEIFELKVAVGAGAGGDLFVIDPQGIAHLVQQAGHRVGRNRNAELGQFLGDRRGGAARPA